MDYYEFLQISCNAEPETIHRVFDFWRRRLHPDNPETGNPEAFFRLKQAYDVLSDPERRAQYDEASIRRRPSRSPYPVRSILWITSTAS